MAQPTAGPNDRHRTLVFALGGAGLLGGIGFVAGFVGPIILTPDSNQGPLLGIFITGPAGFIIGGIAGLIYAQVGAKRKR